MGVRSVPSHRAQPTPRFSLNALWPLCQSSRWHYFWICFASEVWWENRAGVSRGAGLAAARTHVVSGDRAEQAACSRRSQAQPWDRLVTGAVLAEESPQAAASSHRGKGSSPRKQSRDSSGRPVCRPCPQPIPAASAQILTLQSQHRGCLSTGIASPRAANCQ